MTSSYPQLHLAVNSAGPDAGDKTGGSVRLL